MRQIERPSYYDAPDDDCPHCGWGPIGCNEDETGCVEMRKAFDAEYDTLPKVGHLFIELIATLDDPPFD